jgi:hypothetical protein
MFTFSKGSTLFFYIYYHKQFSRGTSVRPRPSPLPVASCTFMRDNNMRILVKSQDVLHQHIQIYSTAYSTLVNCKKLHLADGNKDFICQRVIPPFEMSRRIMQDPMY